MEDRSRFSIFVTILSIFAVVVVLTGAAITIANYLQARQAAMSVASETFDAAVRRVNEERSAFYSPVNLVVDLYSHDRRIVGERDEVEAVLFSVLHGLHRTPQISGVYVGYENGEFYQALSFSEHDADTVAALNGPVGARYALETIRPGKTGVPVETWRFYDDGLNEVASHTTTPSTYDPRVRVWYTAARARPHEFIRTSPYVFAATPQVGLTVAASFDGPMGGVVGADVTLDRLSSSLELVRPNQSHRILVFKDDGGLIATPDPDQVIKRTGAGNDLLLEPAKITDLKDPVIQAVARQFSTSGPFRLKSIDVDGDAFLASVVPQEAQEGAAAELYVLYAAPRSDFEGTLTGTATRSIVPGLLILLLASPAIVYLARRVSRPLTELANNAKLIEAIIDTIPNPVFYKDPESKYIGCNGAFESYYNLKRADIVGRRLTDLEFMPESERVRHQGEHEEVIRNGSSIRREMTLPLSDGRIRQTLYHVTGFRQGDGSAGGLVGTLVDITELKDAQQAMSEAKELAEAATKSKSDFLASMSHEIRTPMNGVTGMADLMAQTKLDDDQKHMLRTIRDSGNALLTIINDILDISKIEAGKLDIESVSMSVADVVEGVASTLTPNATGKGIRIDTYVDPAIDPALLGDPVRVRQILFNLTGNAIKFSDKKDVAVRATADRTDPDGRIWVRFDIIDHGIGISPENQTKLFQAFSQAESSTTRKYGGTGLGLAICKRLVEMMGGTVGLASTEGKGSVFTAEIPFMPTDTSRSQEKPRDLTDLRVALVASSGMRQEAIVAYLRHWGAEVTIVADAPAVVEFAREAHAAERPLSSVILDCGLNPVSQNDAIQRLRKALPQNKTPLILLQDYQTRSARVKADNVLTVDANPVIRYRIVSAVAVAAGRASPEVQADAEVFAVKPGNAPTVEEARAQGELILLAEDNLTNQDVIRRQLTMLGYACEIANNGREALSAWRTGRYAMLLTDCHMPEMDGYELTGAIRAEEAAGAKLPIVAVTANALQGEAERCLKAGMDDYVTKPIAMTALRAILQKWMPSRNVPESAINFTLPADATASDILTTLVVDDRVLKDMFGDDTATFKEIMQSFVVTSESIVVGILTAHASRDATAVMEAAHKLKSSSRNVGAGALGDTCASLEAAGRAQDWSMVDTLAPLARAQMDAVADYINKL